MTLLEMKRKVLALIEEINDVDRATTSDPDIEAKLPYVINQIQNELARMKKITAKTTRVVTTDESLDLTTLDNFYQLNVIRGVDFDSVEQFVKFLEPGIADIYYYRYPTKIDENTEDAFEFELSNDALEIMPYGVAADLLKSDVSNGYGQIYAARYKELLQTLDPRVNMGSVYIEGGIEI